MSRKNRQVITTNADNWTGKMTTGYLFARRGELILEHNDWTYRIEADMVVEPNGYGGGFYCIKLYMGDEKEHPIVVVSKFGKDLEWEAFAGEISEGSLSRTGRCPVEAAIRVLSNIV